MASNLPRTIRPSWALGICDICGFAFPLNELRAHIYDQRPDGLLVCPEDWDLDNPQLQLGRFSADDPQSLFNPRPDIDKVPSTTYFGWMPVGNPITQTIYCEVGNVEILVV